MNRKFLYPTPKRARLNAKLSPAGGFARLLALLVLGTVLTGCQDAESPVAPTLDDPEFRRSSGRGLKGAIAFHSSRDGGTFNDVAIFVMNADGTDVTQLTNTADALFDLSPSWSPNGKRIAFFRFDGSAKLMVMNEDGTGQTQLTDGVPAAWSPNGKKIVFNRFPEIFVINADGSGETSLGVTGIAHDWSPNGKQILFSNGNLFVMNADGSDPTQLTVNGSFDLRARWSPNGKKVVFASFRNNNVDIYVINADGSGETRLTSHPATDNHPVWSPNGKQIAFTSERDGDEEIFVMNADGTDVTQLTFNEGSLFLDALPDWRARPLRP